MALSRLLLSRTVFHCSRREILLSARWCRYSSSGKLTQKDEVMEDTTASAQSKAEIHPKILPKPLEAENKSVGSWYSLKDIYINLKEKVLGNHQGLKQVSNEISDLPISSASSKKAMMTQISEDGAKSGESEILHLLSEVATDSSCSEQSISTSATSNLLGEKSSEDADNTTAQEVIKLHSPDKFKLSEPAIQVVEAPKNFSCTETENLVQFMETMTISPCDERNTSNSAAYPVTEENLCKEIVGLEEKMAQSKGTWNNSSTINLDNEQWQGKKMDSTPPYSDVGQKKESKQLLAFTSYLLDDAFAKMPNEDANNFSPTEIEACQHEKKSTSFVVRLNDGHTRDEKEPVSSIYMLQAGCKMEEMPSAPVGNQKVDGSVDLHKISLTNQTEGHSAGVHGKHLTTIAFSSDSDETSQENVSKPFDVQSIIGITEELSRVQSTYNSLETAMSNVTDQISNKQPNDKAQLLGKVQKTRIERKMTLVDGHDVSKDDNRRDVRREEKNLCMASIIHNEAMTRNEGAGNLDTAGNGQLELKTTPKVALSKKEKNANFAERPTENILLLRFLTKDIQESDIEESLRDCGPILKIQKLSSFKEGSFCDAIVHFEEEKMQKALEKTDLKIKQANPFFQSFSVEGLAHQNIYIPDLVGDPDAPAALLKHPTRTVKIEHLNSDISLEQLRKALSLCGSKITGFFLGESDSTAYVEFNGYDAKEKALEKHSIHVSGEELLIFRIDAPRTTVVRIDNVDHINYGKAASICRKKGKLMRARCRLKGTLDLHFSVSELPNMLNILNSLNGLEVDGRRLIAKPAPVFPPAILQALWSHPEEREHVKEVIRHLLKENYPTAPELVDVVAKHYEVEF